MINALSTDTTTGTQGQSSTSANPTGSLDKNAFLNLLMTQLQHQDPMNPMDDQNFMAQMAQFSTLEQITNLAQEMTTVSFSSQVSQATGLIGHPITWLNADGTTGNGIASNVTVSDGQVQIGVGSSTVQLSQIQSIDPIPQAPATDPATLAADIAAAIAASATAPSTDGSAAAPTDGAASSTSTGGTTPATATTSTSGTTQP